MPGFLKKDNKNIHIGLDIGGHSVKAVAISQIGAKHELLNYSIKPVGDNIVDSIKDAHAALGITKIDINTSISGPAVVVRYIEMPSMSEDELESATRFEAEKVIPYNINEVELDSAKVEDLDGNRMRVIFVAAKKDLIDSQTKLIFEAGLRPVVLDIDSFCLMNSFLNTGKDSDGVCALINIGSRKTNLNIVHGDISYLSRDIDIGGNEINRIMAENLSLKPEEIEKIKKEKLSKFLQLSEEEKKDIEGPLEEMLSRVVDEIRLSFDFYENHYAGRVDKIYISGGTSTPEVVSGFLKEAFDREALRWNPLENIEISNEVDADSLSKIQPQLAIAVGLGLRKI
ncbi:MAG: type IV pilus assembly protein PilM [Candidatus Omnitrophica bacterium]|nr:type IV pilus assembly protein PilM [Candidatus Omnitrophota bacterium]